MKLETKKRLFYGCLVAMLLSPLLFGVVLADDVETETAFELQFGAGGRFQYQSVARNTYVVFDVQTVGLNGTAELTATSAGGTMEITPTTTGLLYVFGSGTSDVWIKINGITTTIPFGFTSGVAFTVTWVWAAAPAPPSPYDFGLGGDITLLLTYLQAGDLLGFLFACYTTRIGQFFYLILVLMFTVPLGLRTQSFTYVAVVWIILAGVFQAAVPMIAPASVLLVILGFAALIYKAYTKE